MYYSQLLAAWFCQLLEIDWVECLRFNSALYPKQSCHQVQVLVYKDFGVGRHNRKNRVKALFSSWINWPQTTHSLLWFLQALQKAIINGINVSFCKKEGTSSFTKSFLQRHPRCGSKGVPALNSGWTTSVFNHGLLPSHHLIYGLLPSVTMVDIWMCKTVTREPLVSLPFFQCQWGHWIALSMAGLNSGWTATNFSYLAWTKIKLRFLFLWYSLIRDGPLHGGWRYASC